MLPVSAGPQAPLVAQRDDPVAAPVEKRGLVGVVPNAAVGIGLGEIGRAGGVNRE